MKITREAYAKLIEEDIDWLLSQPRTLERDHIRDVLRGSIDLEYPKDPLTDGRERYEEARRDLAIVRAACVAVGVEPSGTAVRVANVLANLGVQIPDGIPALVADEYRFRRAKNCGRVARRVIEHMAGARTQPTNEKK